MPDVGGTELYQILRELARISGQLNDGASGDPALTDRQSELVRAADRLGFSLTADQVSALGRRQDTED